MNHAMHSETVRACKTACLMAILYASPFCAAASEPPKPCELFTKQAAEAIFGAPLDKGQEAEMTCTYNGAGGDDRKSLMVNFIPASGASPGMSMSETYDNLIHQDPKASDEPIAGLGERADYILSEDHTQGAVEVLYHNTIVGVMATSSPNPKLKAALIEAVRQMIEKIWPDAARPKPERI